MKDALGYYHTLQVEKNADNETIKQSYRELAKIWHPDNNRDKDTTDMFQKISVAYEVLNDKENRLIYDILSSVYSEYDYPNLENITPYEDNYEGVKITVVKLSEVKSWLIGYQHECKKNILTLSNALKSSVKISLINWILGWWHPKAFFLNLKAIKNNFREPVSETESLKIWIHNMIAYHKSRQNLLSARCGLQAINYLDDDDKKYIDNFISQLNVRVSRPQKINILPFKVSQFIFPLCLIAILFIINISKYTLSNNNEFWSIFSNKKEIDYYQKVDFGNRGESVDDVVVGKVLSIPVDKSDNSKLYHLNKETKVMYGPSSDFDIVKTLAEGTTVRLTGYTPDNIWGRILIDNGESGFVKLSDIEQGKGNDIPFGSAIIE